MSKTLLSIDPGLSSGVTLWEYGDSKPAELLKSWQVEGGIEGFLEWNTYNDRYTDDVVVEKFTPRQSLTLASAEPLLIEGALITLGYVPPYQPGGKNVNWQHPAQMYFTGGDDLAAKKKRAHKWLKDKGLYVTGKDVGCKDANDVRSSMLHAMVWFRTRRHMPTLKHYFGGSE